MGLPCKGLCTRYTTMLGHTVQLFSIMTFRRHKPAKELHEYRHWPPKQRDCLTQNFKVPFDSRLKVCFHVRYWSTERYALIVYWILRDSACSQLNYTLKPETLFTTINMKYLESPSVVLKSQFDMSFSAPGFICFKSDMVTMWSIKKDWYVSFSKFIFLLPVSLSEFYCILLYFAKILYF